MRKLSLQFHALPSEIPDLFSELMDDLGLFVVELVGKPPGFRLLGDTERAIFDQYRDALAFSIVEPQLDAINMNEFRIKNPDALVLQIGSITDKGLSESWLSAMTDNKAAMDRWRKASKHAQAKMLIGATAVNPHNGAEAPMKWHRFTYGAQNAYENGTNILPSAGNSVIKLPDLLHI